MNTAQIRPSSAWYWVAGAMMVGAVVGSIAGFVFGFLSLSRQIDDFQRVPLPGQGEVSFTEPGTYLLYYEGPGAQQGGPAFTALLVPVGGESGIPISDYGSSVSYDFPGHSGIAVASFPITDPGRYRLQTGADEGIKGTVAVGSSISGGIVAIVVAPLVGGFLLFTAGAVLAIVVAIRRRRALRGPPAPNMTGWQGAPGPPWNPGSGPSPGGTWNPGSGPSPGGTWNPGPASTPGGTWNPGSPGPPGPSVPPGASGAPWAPPPPPTAGPPTAGPPTAGPPTAGPPSGAGRP